MPLQSTGAISLTDIQTEFGGANPIGIVIIMVLIIIF